MKALWTLFVAILVTGTAFAVQNDKEEKVKRQTVRLSTELGPNGETILFVDGQETVYLTGSNARFVDILAGETVTYLAPDSPVVTVTGDRVGPFDNIFRYSSRTCPPPPGDVGPGRLYLSTGRAFFTNCQDRINQITQFAANAQDLVVDFEVEMTTDGGNRVTQLNINEGEFTLILQGASSTRIGSGQRVSYSGMMLRAAGEVVSDRIDEFFVVRQQPGSDVIQTSRFNTSTPINFRGPGQLYVGMGDTKAAFIEDISFRSPGSTNPADSISQEVAQQTFMFTSVGDTTDVTNRLTMMPIITLSSDTKIIDVSDAFNVSYSSDGNVRFFSRGGRLIATLPGVEFFSVFDKSEVTTAASPDTLDLEFSTVGGSVYIDPIENTAMFLSDSNRFVATEFNMQFTLPEAPSYAIATDGKGVRLLTSTSGSPPATEAVQTVTGSFVRSIRELETFTYRDNEIVVANSMGTPILRITEVDQLIADSGTTSGIYNSSTVVSFAGPGTLSYSRGTAFYTTNPDLGRSIGFQSSTAPIPQVEFKAEEVGIGVVEGVNYTMYRIEQTIGGDRVVTFEATSYTTSSSQEIIYSGNQVSVHTPIRTSGMVVYDGSAETLRYRMENGSVGIISGVETFRYFSGGDVSTVPSGESTTINLPGNIYFTSDDETEVLFASSNIITPEVAGFIRQRMADFSLMNVDQFSSIYTGRFNLSTDSATVSYGGGGVIWDSISADNRREALYVDDQGVSDRIEQSVSTLLLITKSRPAKRNGIINIIFNGRDIYPYSPILGNRDITIGTFDSFIFNGTALVGRSLPDGPYTGINRVIVFDGVEVREVNSTDTADGPVEFKGYGLLLVQNDSDTAFYTTSIPTINFLLQSIKNVREFLVSPSIQAGTGERLTKSREASFIIGTDVTAYEGASISFECNVAGGRPEPSVGFYRVVPDGPDIKLNESNGHVVVNNTLTLINIMLDDSAVYMCRASNGVPPDAEVSSSLTVREAVPPELRERYYPYDVVPSNTKIIWPTERGTMETVIWNVYMNITFACRFTGRPRARVQWVFNERPIEMATQLEDRFSIVEVIQGASILTIDRNLALAMNPLLGNFTVQCNGVNAAGGLARGTARVHGIRYFECDPVDNSAIPCSRSCGFGLRDLTFPFCMLCERSDSSCVPVNIDDVPFSVVPLSSRQVVCAERFEGTTDIAICPLTEYRWNVSEWSECSRTCGGGIRTRNVTCLNMSIPLDSRYEAQLDRIVETEAEDNMCVMFEQAGERPTEQELCATQRCPFWQTSKYSMCSATCDGGISVRVVECVELRYYRDVNGTVMSNITVVDDADCDMNDRPDMTRPCNEQRCFYHWNTSKFGNCGALEIPVSSEFPNCRQRDVVCLNEHNRIVDNDFCSHLPRPSILGSCDYGICFIGLWGPLPWSDCSEPCGYGTQTRGVACYSPESRTLVADYFCDSAKKPPTERQCFQQNCEDTCLRDESPICPIVAEAMMCGSDFAMGNNGLRCCVSCMGMAGGD